MTARRPFEDGVHYVAPAPNTDRQPLRWLIKAVRASGLKSSRRAETKDEAIGIAQRLTQQAIATSPVAAALHAAHCDAMLAKAEARTNRKATPTTAIEKPARRRPGRPASKPRAPLEKFATTHFNCIRANPAAQVWQCVSSPDERKPVGRRKAGGRLPDQAPVRHTKGECAVMMGSEPFRSHDGSVVVFPNWQQAELTALELYHTADEEERIFWQEPEGRVVGRTMEIEIIFDPTVNGANRPFNLWFFKHNKPYYRSARLKHTASNAKDASGRTYEPVGADERAAHDLNRTIEKMAQEDNKMLSMEIAKFRTIWEAEAEAIRLEKEYFGNGEFYQ